MPRWAWAFRCCSVSYTHLDVYKRQEQYRSTIRQAFREVSDALVAIEQLGLQREAASRVVSANRERLRVTRARYLSGVRLIENEAAGLPLKRDWKV